LRRCPRTGQTRRSAFDQPLDTGRTRRRCGLDSVDSDQAFPGNGTSARLALAAACNSCRSIGGTPDVPRVVILSVWHRGRHDLQVLLSANWLNRCLGRQESTPHRPRQGRRKPRRSAPQRRGVAVRPIGAEMLPEARLKTRGSFPGMPLASSPATSRLCARGPRRSPRPALLPTYPSPDTR
jgi:hypothetical protein